MFCLAFKIEKRKAHAKPYNSTSFFLILLSLSLFCLFLPNYSNFSPFFFERNRNMYPSGLEYRFDVRQTYFACIANTFPVDPVIIWNKPELPESLFCFFLLLRFKKMVRKKIVHSQFSINSLVGSILWDECVWMFGYYTYIYGDVWFCHFVLFSLILRFFVRIYSTVFDQKILSAIEQVEWKNCDFAFIFHRKKKTNKQRKTCCVFVLLVSVERRDDEFAYVSFWLSIRNDITFLW